MAIRKFADEVMADGPIGYWRLGDRLGSVTAADAGDVNLTVRATMKSRLSSSENSG